MIGTTTDIVNVPWNKSFLTPGPDAPVHNVLLQYGCPTDLSNHFTITYSSRTAGLVLQGLDPSYAKPIPCPIIAPVSGLSL